MENPQQQVRNLLPALAGSSGWIQARFKQRCQPIHECDQLCNIQLNGPFFLTQHLLSLIADQGRIVNISTGLTRFALPGFAAYAAVALLLAEGGGRINGQRLEVSGGLFL